MPDQPQQSKGLGGTLKSKWGPLPVWGWLAIITALAVGYYLWSRRQGSQQQPTTGQPGVVVINQGDQDTGTKPPKPPEDHDKDDQSGKKHDDDDHHRHRKRHHGKDETAQQNGSGGGTSPALGVPSFPTAHQPGPPNVGQFFPVVGPPDVDYEGGPRRIG